VHGEAVDHVIRSVPPWREATVTECGRNLEGLPLITRDELLTRVQNEGQRRAAFITCMVCWETVYRTKSWEQDPALALAREFGRYGINGGPERMRLEMRALMLLVEAHREEFFETLAALQGTSELSRARAKRARRR
jgi:hypothetical protein